MANPEGFLRHTEREVPKRRPVPLRLKDWKEVYEEREAGQIERQAGRCMDCGVPFCHQGCPLGNLIPEWNDLVYRDDWKAAIDRLHTTNNFPEFTGRLCPAPCESSCVLGINQPAVTIKQSELSIIDTAWERGYITPVTPDRLTGKTVAIVGSGPAGLAAAQQLTRIGHTVAVFERDEAPGGLLRYGIPDFKMEKHHIDRRIAQMEEEGTRFRTGVTVGVDITWDELRLRYDAVIIATGAPVGRDLPIPGRNLAGIHFAMEYLARSNRAVAGDTPADFIDAAGKHVVILGGGDTGADCIGTALRQGAASVTTLAIGKQPPHERPADQPWPMDPTLFEVQSAHEEGGERVYLASTVEFVGDEAGNVTALTVAETEYFEGGRRPLAGTEKNIPADLVFLALGFTGVDTQTVVPQVGLDITKRGVVERSSKFDTNLPGVFVAGDAGRGASLIVWAIAEGRAAAARADEFLSGQTNLPSPVRATDTPIHF
ncbi:glutamate synthase (NADH) small subunit [Microbacteriaceae bacterium MWH-Ta3]|nr:glutamate synthase (NADH) small subunit [Microbacteriaceae bacterium MWH-Ta3]